MASVTKIENNFKLKLSCEELESAGNKWELMGLDDHLKASAMAGLIDKYKGASNYLNDRPNPGQASRILLLRVKSKKERLDLQKLQSQEIPSFPETTKATHVVVGITYGAEAYCVLTYDLDKKLDEEEAREVANEALADLATKLENALADSQDLASFQGQFSKDEKQRLSRMKCRLYADFQTQAVRECNVFDAYKHCLKLIEQVENKTGGEKSKVVPIAVKLCPLKNVIDPSKNVGEMLEYRDVDADLISRCCVIWGELERISGEAESVRETIHKSSRPSLRQFSETIFKFRDLLKKNLKNAIVKARDGKNGEDGEEEVEKIVDIAEKHPLFKARRLERWLQYKKAESEMMEKLNKVKGVILFSSKKQLEAEISDSGKKYTLALSVSALDQRTKDILAGMKGLVKSNNSTLLVNGDSDEDTTDEGAEEDDETPWHMVQRKRKQVLDKMRELADHAEKNKHLENQVNFFAVIGESQVKGLCRYSVYEFDNVSIENLSLLPAAPTGLRIQLPGAVTDNKTAKNFPPVRVEWDYEYVGYPCHFIVEHRLKGNESENWIQQKTTKPGEKQIAINIKHGSPIEIRVAAGTCIGRSEYSDVIDNDSSPDDAENSQSGGSDNISGLSDQPIIVTSEGIELEECVEMAALGRRFQLGNLYDYRNDRITEPRLSLESSTQIDDTFKLNLSCEESENAGNKWELMGLDDHLKATAMGGLIDKYNGASNYMNDRLNSSQTSRILVLRAVSRREILKLSKYADPSAVNSTHLKKATHVVTGITYGAEAYCVLIHDLDEEAGESATDTSLSDLGEKLTNALRENSTRFQEQFNREEKQRLTRVKCLIYADFQTQVVRECNVFDAYKHCLKLIEQVENKTGGEKSKAVPIAVNLCPLKNVIDPAKNVRNMLECRDVDSDLISRCCVIWGELERIICDAEVVRAKAPKDSRSALNQFIDAITRFQDMVKKNLKSEVVKARESEDGDEEIGKIVDIVEEHSLFKASLLEQWLRFKKAETEIASKLTDVRGVTFLASKDDVEMELTSSLDTKHSLVMWIPSLDGRTREILGAMTAYVDSYEKLVKGSSAGKVGLNRRNEVQLPWHMDERKRKQVQEKIRKFVDYTNKNRHLENETNFFMAFGDGDKGLSCSYSVYEASNLLADNLYQLPGPPTDLRAELQSVISGKSRGKKSLPSIRVEWNYEELGFPCCFLVEYRPKGSYNGSWKQQKTKSGETQTTISCERGSEMEIRVAADTCIGRSEFSKVVDSESVSDDDDCSRNLDSDGDSMMSVASEKSESFQSFQVSIKGRDSRRDSKPTRFSNNNRLDQSGSRWEREDVSSYSGDTLDYDPQISQQKETNRQLAAQQTSNDRLALNVIEQNRPIGQRNGMDLYAIPLKKTSEAGATCQRFSYGKSNGGRKQHKTILVMGATGAGKTTLINGMMNYIFDVQWEDPFRFQLIQEQVVGDSQSNSQTSQITAYDIHYSEGFRVPYSLTIVDTPGYGDTKGLDRDQEITEMIRKFFEDKKGIQQLDVVGFVAQASLPRLTPTQIYIFDSVLSIFGNDVKNNINFLLTFADSQVPPILDAIAEANLPCPADSEGTPRHHKFNNSGFFCSSRESGGGPVDKFNKFFWEMGIKNFENFFNMLTKMETISLSLTKQVLEERKRLEATVDGLEPLIKAGLSKMEELRKTEQMVSNSEAQINANENVEFEFDVTVARKVEIRAGQYLTNCNKCSVTCHNPCMIPNDNGKVNCAAMDFSKPAADRTCTVCPQKCIWNLHANQPYRWEYVQEKQATSSDEIKAKYEKELNKKLSAQDLVAVLKEDIGKNEKIVLERVETVTSCIKKLEEIALRPNPFSTPAYIDLIIDAEQQEKRSGFQERIKSLQRLRQMAEITSTIQKKGSLFERGSRGKAQP